ncbi:UPF0176 protein [Seinonella peptonophila]|uniref:tRNA uridine(34) hydroxylase n=1 Tax=Seinonella peptonophila TaxID=112248 RepID=A0A1M4T048_9BACL|nr:rhodanese-related sulfurtransferase [Seinonella peptonophila]SHE37858.1 UPF0176 protein [Seinonella peptonophila]
MTNQDYQILLYYKFIHVQDPETEAKVHLDLCKQLDLRGRVLIAPEGINGTVSGTIAQTNAYMDYMNQHPLFNDIVYKIDPYHQHAFKKMFVRSKKELVTFRVEHELDPSKKTGQYLSPKKFYELLKDDDVIVIDGRNDYEYDLGHFRNAVRPDVSSFREFPEWIEKNLSQFKGRKILTYCTGGIRCEKLTAYMLEEGFDDVYQLDGGIVSYGRDPEVKGEFFDGKCYVFDERISVPINRVEEKIVGTCIHCGNQTEQYINCRVTTCNLQHLCCEDCNETFNGFCSHECKEKTDAVYLEEVR